MLKKIAVYFRFEPFFILYLNSDQSVYPLNKLCVTVVKVFHFLKTLVFYVGSRFPLSLCLVEKGYSRHIGERILCDRSERCRVSVYSRRKT